MTTGRKLALGAVIITAVATYLAMAGANSSWRYYVTVDECVDQGPLMVGSQLRIYGRVGVATLHVDRARQQATFALAGQRGSVDVVCTGPLPDDLAEGMEVVVEGKLERQNLVRGHKVMTKCAGKYASQGSS